MGGAGGHGVRKPRWGPAGGVPPSDELGPTLLELLHGGRPKKSHGPLELVLQDVDGLHHALLAARREAVKVRLAAPHGVRAQRDGLGDVRPAHHPPVQDDLHVVPHGLPDPRKRIDRRHAGLQLPAAVVAHPQRGEPVVQGPHGVVLPHHPLECELTTPLVGEPLGVLPAEVRAQLRVHEGGHGLRGDVLGDVGVGVHVVAEEVPRPRRPLHRAVDLGQRVGRRHAEPVADVPLPLAEPSEVGGQRAGVVAVLPGLLQQRTVQALVLPQVQLKDLGQGLGEDLADVLHRSGGEGGEAEEDALLRRRRRGRLLAQVVEHPVPGRGAAEERQAHVPAEDLGGHVQGLGRVPRQHPVVTLVLGELRAGAPDGDLVVRPGVQVPKAHLVRPLLRCLSQVPSVAALGEPGLGGGVHDGLNDGVEEPEELVQAELVDESHGDDSNEGARAG
mmetsp:Transcript_3299/g.11998  ORF Transcript_3299/g.11998 Transcript_3299/m.11998 type:complete len:445 (-) Transcript_3299:151-1485(-)